MLRGDDSVDAYVADLQRLLALSGYKAVDAAKDPIVIEQLNAGLPRGFSRQLRL